MTKKRNLLKRSVETLRHDGLMDLSRKAGLYLGRRVAWRSEALTKRLDFAISRNYLLREYGTLIKRNRIFRDRHKEQRCFVIGNGPSLRKQDLSPLRNEITLVSNSFYLHPIIDEAWQPTYYFLSDPIYFSDTANLIEYDKLLGKIRLAAFFVPHFARDFLIKNEVLPSERTYFVASWGGPQEETWRAKPDLTSVMPGMQTVVQLAIMAAMYMGCSEIYLLGMDHDWLSHGGDHINFYSKASADEQPQGNIQGWRYKSMMESVLVMWQIYEELEEMARAEGIKIVNASAGGFLDVFERGHYESIIGDASN